MLRSQLSPMPEYFDRYIMKTDDVELLEAIRISIAELDMAPVGKWTALGDRAYAPGKWSVKEILQHLIDTERIFCYRALAFARKESVRLPSYSEDEYGAASDANRRSAEDLVAELRTLHHSTLQLFSSFTPEMLARSGMGFKGPYTVASVGFILPGHQRWHFGIINERYMPLLENNDLRGR